MFYVYFRGRSTRGELIKANTLKDAKWIFALKHNVNSISYIAGKRGAQC